MSTMTLKSLVDKLTPHCKKKLEAAAGLCNSRSHFSVEIQHWLAVMAEGESGDLAVISSAFDLDLAELRNQLLLGLEQLKTGNCNPPGLSPQVVALLRAAWMAATIEFNESAIRSVHIIYALLSDESLVSLLHRDARELLKVDASRILSSWPAIEKDSTEGGSRGASEQGSSHSLNHSSQALAQYTIDLTAQAKAGEIDPILGRDNEIRQMIDILTRRRQNNPILTGEAGVGKTAVVEGLAQRIADGDVPEVLQNISIRVLDLALLQAGAGMKGEFENRLKTVIKEVKSSPVPIILFIDEAHTLIGSGGQAGQNDAANLLKPALARGELRTIAATTWAEYKKYFEKDAALARRFQVVKIEEPDEETAVVMLRGLLPVMEAHHHVTITDKALQFAVKLSNRYINGRQLPDKAVGLLDTACARVAMSQVSMPGQVEELTSLCQQLKTEIAVLEKEVITGSDHGTKLAQLESKLQQADAELHHLENQWRDEVGLVKQAKDFSQKLMEGDVVSEEDKAQFKEMKNQLTAKVEPMVHLEVGETLVAEVIADWTGIPLGRMRSDEIDNILSLSERMKQRVIGQDHALDQIAQVVKTARAQLSDERRPDGIFLLTGPSGVGKTESALALAEQVYGSEDNITVINMSEFKEEHKVSLLVGSPPGYVGFGEGGILTEAVRRKPYSVVLLDEMEKAHPGVQDIFYQVFDKGTLKDGEGRDIDFKNTIIIMTSNAGTETTMELYEDEETSPSIPGLKEALKDDLLQVFKPAFLGRLDVIPYVPLSNDVLKEIIKLQLNRISDRIKNNYNAEFKYTDNVVDYLRGQSNNDNSGARSIHNNLQQFLLPLLSGLILKRLSTNSEFDLICVDVCNDNYNVIFS
ncbi:type VI secretion system ATPase TssH [Photobacterium sp. J15]|uniref:type VI secretion system ATPase TssH n=1 Tax=Photobacterium sp. J15 TaxID=265901 RepID=UPI0007E4500D|nr:type VI secretion system ATPase TssH [Photobacterium sp. J15]